MKFNIKSMVAETDDTVNNYINNKLLEYGDPEVKEPDPRLKASAEKIKDFKKAYGPDIEEETLLFNDTGKPFYAIYFNDDPTLQGVTEPNQTLPQDMPAPEPTINTAKSQWYLEIPKAITAIQYLGNNYEAMGDFCNNGRYRITQLENGALMLADGERNTVINPGDYVASLKSGFSVYPADDFVKEYRYIERDSDAIQTNPQTNIDAQQQEPIPQPPAAMFFHALGKKALNPMTNYSTPNPIGKKVLGAMTNDSIPNNIGGGIEAIKIVANHGQAIKNDISQTMKGTRGRDMMNLNAEWSQRLNKTFSTPFITYKGKTLPYEKFINFDGNSWKDIGKNLAINHARQEISGRVNQWMGDGAEKISKKITGLIVGKKPQIVTNPQPQQFHSPIDAFSMLVLKKHLAPQDNVLSSDVDLNTTSGIQVGDEIMNLLNDALNGKLDYPTINEDKIQIEPTNLDNEGA